GHEERRRIASEALPVVARQRRRTHLRFHGDPPARMRQRAELDERVAEVRDVIKDAEEEDQVERRRLRDVEQVLVAKLDARREDLVAEARLRDEGAGRSLVNVDPDHVRSAFAHPEGVEAGIAPDVEDPQARESRGYDLLDALPQAPRDVLPGEGVRGVVQILREYPVSEGDVLEPGAEFADAGENFRARHRGYGALCPRVRRDLQARREPAGGNPAQNRLLQLPLAAIRRQRRDGPRGEWQTALSRT